MNLCKCLNCDSVLEDTNPQTGARDWDLESLKIRLHRLVDHKCPKCKVDDYLTDDVVESDIGDLLV